MLPFKKSQLPRAFLILGLVLNLAACTLPEPKSKTGETEQDNGTFFIEKAKVIKIGEKLHANISLPTAKIFNFQVCMRDLQHSKEIINHNFDVQIGSKTEQLRSDASGCINWSETIEYNHLAEAKWVEVNRTIQARGFQKGQRIASFALNPWEDLGHSLLDTEINDLQKGEKAIAALKGSGDPQQNLWIDDLRLTIDEKKITKEGVSLNIEIRTVVSFSLIKTANRRVLEPLTNGEIEAEIMLINALQENSKDVRRPLTPLSKTKASVAGGSLFLESTILLKTPARYGQIQLALRLKPVHAPEGLQAFNGVFNIAEYDQFKGSSFSRLKNVFHDGKMTIEDYLTDKEIPPQDPASISSIATSEVQVSPLDFRIVQFKNQKGLSREKVFSVSACLKAPIDLKPLRNHVFKIQKINGQTEERTSNELGCISWQDSVTYDLLNTECWQTKEFQLSNENLGLKQKMQIRVNAWSNESSSLLDPRFSGKQDLLCASGKPKIILTGYSFDKKFIDYDIDPYLNIKLKKEGILKLTARLKRPSLTSSTGFEETALPPGKYNLRWAIVDQSVTDFSKASGKIFQIGEKQVQIDAEGLVSESLTFETVNLKALGNTNYFLLEVEGLDSSENLARTTYRGTIVLSSTNEASNLEPVYEGPDSLVNKVKAQYTADLKKQTVLLPKLASKEHLAQSENLRLINLKYEKDSEDFRRSLSSPTWWHPGTSPALKNREMISLPELQSWLQKGQLTHLMAYRLCGYWFQDHLQRPLAELKGKSILPSPGHEAGYFARFCRQTISKDPSRFFDIHFRYFMKNPKKVRNLSTMVKDLSFNQSFNLSQSHDVAVTKTWSADVNAGATTAKILEMFAPFSLSGGIRYQIARSRSDRQSNGGASGVSSGESLLLERLDFEMKSQGYEKCAVVRLNLETLDQKAEQWEKAIAKSIPQGIINQQLSQGLLICDDQLTEKALSFTERFYIINQRNFYTQAIDSNSNIGRPLFMALRGTREFRRVMKALGGTVKTPQSANVEQAVNATKQSHLLPFFSLGVPTYPGQYLADE